jgi:hypothetical protein
MDMACELGHDVHDEPQEHRLEFPKPITMLSIQPAIKEFRLQRELVSSVGAAAPTFRIYLEVGLQGLLPIVSRRQ